MMIITIKNTVNLVCCVCLLLFFTMSSCGGKTETSSKLDSLKLVFSDLESKSNEKASEESARAITNEIREITQGGDLTVNNQGEIIYLLRIAKAQGNLNLVLSELCTSGVTENIWSKWKNGGDFTIRLLREVVFFDSNKSMLSIENGLCIAKADLTTYPLADVQKAFLRVVTNGTDEISDGVLQAGKLIYAETADKMPSELSQIDLGRQGIENELSKRAGN